MPAHLGVNSVKRKFHCERALRKDVPSFPPNAQSLKLKDSVWSSMLRKQPYFGCVGVRQKLAQPITLNEHCPMSCIVYNFNSCDVFKQLDNLEHFGPVVCLHVCICYLWIIQILI